MKKNILAVCLTLALLVVPAISNGTPPSVSEIRVSDVTTRSFSVVWVVNETDNAGAGWTGGLEVYGTPGCTEPVPGIDFKASEVSNAGVLKKTVTGLSPNTTYCFRTVTTSRSISGETTIAPVAPADPLFVTTETQTVRTYTQGTDILPFGNDLIYHPVYRYDQTIGDNKKILIVSIEGVGSSPVSAWTGDGIFPPDVIIDLNNIFSASTHENMNLMGGERMKLLEIRGQDGCTLERWRKVPLDNELEDYALSGDLVEVRAPGTCFDPADLDCNNWVNILDILRDVSGYNTKLGDLCFNSDLDVKNNDGWVNILDILYVVGKYNTRKID